ncbi:MAG: hypothetical protein ABI591_27415 [Kofleriaceae bacterium]
MPAFRYFATIDDSFAILRDLCDRGLRVVIGDHSFASVTDELMTTLRGAPSFCLAGAFTPSLPAHVGRVGLVDDKSTLLPGDISYESPASKALITAYTLAMLTIRNRCTRYATQIFIAPGAMSLVQRGQVAIDNR